MDVAWLHALTAEKEKAVSANSKHFWHSRSVSEQNLSAWLGRVRVLREASKANRIGNESADDYHKHQGEKKDAVGPTLDAVHPAFAARPQRPV